MKMLKWLIAGCFGLGVVFYGFAQSDSSKSEIVKIGQDIEGFEVISKTPPIRTNGNEARETQAYLDELHAIAEVQTQTLFLIMKTFEKPIQQIDPRAQRQINQTQPEVTQQEINKMEQKLQNIIKSRLGARSIVNCVPDKSTGKNGMKCKVDVIKLKKIK